MRLPNRFSSATLSAFLFILLGVTAYFQLSWSFDLQKIEQRRLESQLTKNIVNLTEEILQELFLLPTFATSSKRDTVNLEKTVLAAIQFWYRHTSYQNLYSNIYLFNPGETEPLKRYSDGNFIIVQDDPQVYESVLTEEQMKLEVTPFYIPLSADYILLVNNIFPRNAKQGCYIVCVINYTELTQTIFPDLVQKIFAQDDSYLYRIVNTSTKTTLMSSSGIRSEAAFDNPDFVFPLLPFKNIERYSPSDSFSIEKLPQLSYEIFKFIRTKMRDMYANYTLLLENQQLPSFDHARPLYQEKNTIPYDLFMVEIVHKDGSLFRASVKSTILNIVTSLFVLIILGVGLLILVINMQRAQILANKQQEFISTITHELKTPLAVITSAGENLSAGIINTPEKIKRYGKIIEKEGLRLRSDIEFFLMYSNLHPLTRQQNKIIDAAAAVHQVLAQTEPLFAEKKFIVETHIPECPVCICCDETAFTCVIKNIVSNAIKHAEEGKYLSVSLTLTTYPFKIGGKKINSTKNAKKAVILRFTDRGPGIPKKEQKHLFEAFSRGKTALNQQIEGSGIGLNLAKRIVSVHGGTLHIETSSQRDGTTFTITMPVTDNEGIE